MGRYLMTHSLLSSWLYTMKGNPYEDMTTERDPMAEFMLTLRREPTPTTEAMQNGIDFEDLVTSIINGRGDPNNQWCAAAEKVARRCAGGVLQYKVKKTIEVGGVSLLLYGRLDCLKAGEIIDIKFTKSYDTGKFFSSQKIHSTLCQRGRHGNRFIIEKKIELLLSCSPDRQFHLRRKIQPPGVFKDGRHF